MMPFYEPKDFRIDELYKLTETVEGKEVSSGNYFLVSVDESPRERFPIPGFSSAQGGEATVFLVQAHAQFGGNTWRRAFKVNNCWEIYWPAGGRTWNYSWVDVESVR